MSFIYSGICGYVSLANGTCNVFFFCSCTSSKGQVLSHTPERLYIFYLLHVHYHGPYYANPHRKRHVSIIMYDVRQWGDIKALSVASSLPSRLLNECGVLQNMYGESLKVMAKLGMALCGGGGLRVLSEYGFIGKMCSHTCDYCEDDDDGLNAY